MRMEHRDIHARAGLLRDTLKELHEVQHPALVEAGAAMAGLAAGGGNAAQLGAAARDVIRLLDDHFAKEEQVLFPMSRDLLGEQELEEVARRIDEMDAT